MTVGQDKSKIAREWITFSLAVIACVLSMVSYYETSKNTKKTEIIRSNNILDKAWDIMGGQPGTTTIVSFETDHHKMELARRLIQQVLSENQFYPEALAQMGTYWWSRQNIDKAIEYYQKAIEYGPIASAYSNLGIALYHKHKNTEAIRALKKAIALEPTNPTIHFNLGKLLYGTDDWDESLSSFKRAVVLDPSLVMREGVYEIIKDLDSENSLKYLLSISDVPEESPVNRDKIIQHLDKPDIDIFDLRAIILIMNENKPFDRASLIRREKIRMLID